MRRAQMDPNDIIKHSKLLQMMKFQQAKEDNPHLNQKQLCGMIGTSKSKVYRNQMDLNMDSFYRHKVPLKHRRKPKYDSDQSETEETQEQAQEQAQENKPSRSKSSSKTSSKTSSKKSTSKKSRSKKSTSKPRSKSQGKSKSRALHEEYDRNLKGGRGKTESETQNESKTQNKHEPKQKSEEPDLDEQLVKFAKDLGI